MSKELNLSEIKDLLEKSKTIAIVGLSNKPDRPSYAIGVYLKKKGYKIYPVNPTESEILGEKSYPDLKSLPIIPDIVNVFRRSDTVEPLVYEAIETGVKNIWFQLSVINHKAIENAHKNGIQTVTDRCILVEHRNLL